MKAKQLITLVILVAFFGAMFAINQIQPSRVSEQRQKEAEEAQKALEEANKTAQAAKEKAAQEAAESARANAVLAAASGANAFQVEFICSNGDFIVEVYPDWAPLGAAQFKAAVEAGIYDEARFFRVVPGFVVQWGIPGDPEQAASWGERKIKDDPVKGSNTRGTVTFATAGPNTRTTQLFINYGDNSRLDGMGFAPFGKVIRGMEVVDKINAQYREEPDQGQIESKGNAYLKEYFPKLDYIKEAKLLGEVAAPAAAAPAATQEAAAPGPEAAATQN